VKKSPRVGRISTNLPSHAGRTALQHVLDSGQQCQGLAQSSLTQHSSNELSPTPGARSGNLCAHAVNQCLPVMRLLSKNIPLVARRLQAMDHGGDKTTADGERNPLLSNQP
jgi:hypothetical protein